MSYLFWFRHEPVPEVHPNALKHLSYDEVIHAWKNVVKSIMRSDDTYKSPRWLMIGFLEDGTSAEIIAVAKEKGWLIIHANSPVAKKFSQEIEETERGLR